MIKNGTSKRADHQTMASNMYSRRPTHHCASHCKTIQLNACICDCRTRCAQACSKDCCVRVCLQDVKVNVHAQFREELQSHSREKEVGEDCCVRDGLGVLMSATVKTTQCPGARYRACVMPAHRRLGRLTRKGARLFRLANGANLTSTLSVPCGVYGGGLGRGPKLLSAELQHRALTQSTQSSHPQPRCTLTRSPE